MDEPMDHDDPLSLAAERIRRRTAEEDDRRERLTQFVALLRRRCLELGGQPGLVAVLSAHGLLQYYERLFEQSERDRRLVGDLMRQPPEAA